MYAHLKRTQAIVLAFNRKKNQRSVRPGQSDDTNTIRNASQYMKAVNSFTLSCCSNARGINGRF